MTRTAGALAAAWAVAWAHPALASEIGTSAHKFGLGLSVGAPTGISGKYYLNGRSTAVEGLVAVYSNGWWGGGWYLHATHLWHPDVLAREPGFELPWHVGIGGFLSEGYWGPWRDRWAGDLALGARGQIGLDFDLEDIRLQISGDIGLNLGVTSFGDPFYAPGLYISVRYFF